MTLRFTIRNLRKRPFLNLIKVIGLSLSLSGILLIALFLKNELTYDRFHNKSDKIFRFTVLDKSIIAGKHFARVNNTEYIPGMADYFPEIENFVRLAPMRGGVIKNKEEYILINQAFECDSTFFKVFDSELIVGNPENILNNPGAMVISESFAKKTFGGADPIGQVLTLPSGQFYGKDKDFTIKGILKDFPQNSHFHPDILATPVDKNVFRDWAWVYLLLSDNAEPGKIESGFKDFYSAYSGDKTGEIKIEAHLQNISEIHLHSNKLREIETNGNLSVVYTLSIAALILLIIAFANYLNLNMGMGGFSDKYLFISKVSGSTRLMILKHFFLEGIIILSASVLICGFIVVLSNMLIQNNLGLNLLKGNIPLIITVVLLFCLLGILSGILPLLKHGINNLFSFSNYKNINIPQRRGISKSIIVLQYAISTGLIVAVLVISLQTDYAFSMGMGVETNNLICFEDVHTNVQNKFGVFKDELLKFNSIKSVSAMFEPPGGEANDMFQFTMEGYIRDETNNADSYIGVFPCDYSFASIFNLNFLSGNNFSEKSEDNEGSGEYIINEAAMKRLHYTNPVEIVGKEFGLITNIEGINIPAGKIIAVVEDFHLSSIKKEIEPLVLFKRKNLWLANIVISFQPGLAAEALKDIESVWTNMFPEYPFQYEYVGAMYKNIYRTELLQVRLLSVFTFIALFICSMGLLGLSLLTTQRRTKEIGIRKINGAGINEIMIMLNWDLVKWIIISLILAIPFAFFAMNRWLENYAYKITLSWWIFALSGLTALCIALITVSVQSWKSASRDPVEALRYE